LTEETSRNQDNLYNRHKLDNWHWISSFLASFELWNTAFKVKDRNRTNRPGLIHFITLELPELTSCALCSVWLL